jgi:predicted nucleotidyltransferase
VALKQELEDLLGCRVDLVDAEALHHTLRDRILSEAVSL